MLNNLMFATATWQRATYSQDTSGAEVIDYETVETIPCNIQPLTARMQLFYNERGMEVSHNVYTTATDNEYALNDRLVVGNRQFNIVGIRDQIELGVVKALDVLEYPGAAKRI